MTRWFLALIGIVLAGCGSSGPQRASVSGTVKLNGEVIREGSIRFVPVDGLSGPTAGATITDGAYSIPKADGPLVGSNRVELHAWKLSGRKIPNPMSPGNLMDEKVPAFPPEFGSASELKRDLSPGHNKLDFDLQTDASKP